MNSPAAPSFPAPSWKLVIALASLNLLGYVDRQALVAVAPLLITELGLSRAQMGLLIGASFTVVFALGTLVAGSFADGTSRPRLMAGGLVLWSAATALTGTATSFLPLAAWRALVGVGEATLPPTALTMIGDRVPASRQGLANGLFYAAIPVGFATSFALAGLLAPRIGWRALFIWLGVLGLAAASAVLRLPDPPRRGAPSPPTAGLAVTARELAQALARRPALLLVIAGGALLAFASAAFQHAITWLIEERGFEYSRAALLSAALYLGAGLAGNLGIGAVTDRAQRGHPEGRLAVLAVLGAAGLAATAAFYNVPPDSGLFFPTWFLAAAWLLGWFGPLLATIDEMAPPGRRASVVGLALLVINVGGVASGAYLTGLVGDRAGLTVGLTWSLAPAATGVVLLGLLGLLRAHR